MITIISIFLITLWFIIYLSAQPDKLIKIGPIEIYRNNALPFSSSSASNINENICSGRWQFKAEYKKIHGKTTKDYIDHNNKKGSKCLSKESSTDIPEHFNSTGESIMSFLDGACKIVFWNEIQNPSMPEDKIITVVRGGDMALDSSNGHPSLNQKIKFSKLARTGKCMFEDTQTLDLTFNVENYQSESGKQQIKGIIDSGEHKTEGIFTFEKAVISQ